MTIEHALRILDHASSLAALPRQAHLEVQQALEFLKTILKQKESA